MNEHTATEQAYKNGYEQGKKDAIKEGHLSESYMDEYYGEWANCLECGADNILPCNYCRICGRKMYEEGET